MQTTTSNRRQREIARVREEILDAAAQIFARSGFRGTTINDIARSAGYTAPTLYSYFEGKADIFEALIRSVADDCRAAFETPMPAGLSFAQQLEIVLTRQLESAQRKRNATAVFFAVRPIDEHVSKGRSTNYDDYVARFARWIRRTAKPSELRYEPEDLAYALSGMVAAFVRQSLHRPPSWKLADRAKMIVDVFLNGARGPRRRKGNGGLELDS
ncbi:MAG TPA: TetR/AcrR family transcriptional regulator [Thermoanaerobaculia bacterium]